MEKKVVHVKKPEENDPTDLAEKKSSGARTADTTRSSARSSNQEQEKNGGVSSGGRWYPQLRGVQNPNLCYDTM
ncbi:hypothetical protein ABZP36_009636 [Zizania latifolia]